MDDLRDIGASDFVRFEKIRRRFSNVITDLNLVTNATPGVLQIDPVIVTYDIAPQTGFWNDSDPAYFEDAATVSPAFALFGTLGNTEAAQVIYPVIEFDRDILVESFFQISGTETVLLAVAQFSPDTAGTTTELVGGPLGGAPISDVEVWEHLQPKKFPVGVTWELNIKNQDGANDLEAAIKWIEIEQPDGQPLTLP